MYRHTAHLYDLISEATGKDYAAESRQVDAQIRSRKPDARSLLDVACGTGAHLGHLQSSYEVVGVDIEPAMLAEARKRLPDLELVEGDMRSLALGRRFDAVVCLFSSIGYGSSADNLHAAIATMARHLNPSGVLIVDGWLRPDRWIDPGTTHVVVAGDEGLKVVRAARSRRVGNHSHLEMHYLVVTLDGIDHVVEDHVLTLFTDDQYRSAFSGAGLEVEVVASPMPDRDRYIGQAPSS